MSYKIQLSHKLEPEVLVTGATFDNVLTFTNIGDNIFPGGKVTTYELRFEGDARNFLVGSSLPEIPELAAGETYTHTHNFLAFSEGVTFIWIELKTHNNEKIPIYQTEEFHNLIWKMPFIIRNQDNLTIIKILKEIKDKLDNISRGLSNG